MNTKIVSKHLQILRKKHHYTQDDLAEQLNVSRQAVSKWETGVSVPDLESLLRISKLYDITINDILEPKIQPERISDFEQIVTLPKTGLKEVLKQVDTVLLAAALMGASPGVNLLVENMFPEIDFASIRKTIGRVRVETVEDAQNQIVTLINLWAQAEQQ